MEKIIQIIKAQTTDVNCPACPRDAKELACIVLGFIIGKGKNPQDFIFQDKKVFDLPVLENLGVLGSPMKISCCNTEKFIEALEKFVA